MGVTSIVSLPKYSLQLIDIKIFRVRKSKMIRKRSISSILGVRLRQSRSLPSEEIRKKKDKKVPCHCYKCKGKLVLSKTKLFHDLHEETPEISDDLRRVHNVHEIADDESYAGEGESSTTLRYDEKNRQETGNKLHMDSEYVFIPRRRTDRRPQISEPTELPDIDLESSIDETSDTSETKGYHMTIVGTYEDYSPPPHQELDMKEILPTNNRFLWILLWIMMFRIRFNIPETAIESLIKFIKLVLDEIGGNNFGGFPDSLYLARKELGLKDRFHIFVPCPKCHKLYRKQDVENFQRYGSPSVMNCCHVEFPNSTRLRSRICNTPLSQIVNMNIQPKLEFPFASIRQQLATLYNRSGFESSLRHWTNRSEFDNILTDIYDGKVWKNFKQTNDDNSPNFFRNEVADSHLGLMLNLDWFQPYKSTIHSTGVIYASICNLPRDIRFKRENLLILGLLPGPDEVSLHKINHYLAPMIDELETLWNGVTINRTFECRNGKTIRAALILVSCDIPAARKICGHVSALVSCHRCQKQANYENRHHNFAGMDSMDEWFISRDPLQHREDALGWRRCNTTTSRKQFVKQTGVRWSELLRLPYFDPIRFLTVDPMHCLFLGIAKWIVKRIWIDEGILTPNELKKVQKTIGRFQVPSDLGRVPRKIHAGEGFANFTADQWRTFFTIYATVALWEHLPLKDRKILTHFVRVCTILVSRIVEVNLMKEAHQRLIEIVRLIEQHYGRDKITPNLHLSLHLCECSIDFGPLYAFWCFSFERMNGILGML